MPTAVHGIAHQHPKTAKMVVDMMANSRANNPNSGRLHCCGWVRGVVIDGCIITATFSRWEQLRFMPCLMACMDPYLIVDIRWWRCYEIKEWEQKWIMDGKGACMSHQTHGHRQGLANIEILRAGLYSRVGSCYTNMQFLAAVFTECMAAKGPFSFQCGSPTKNFG